MCLAVMGGAAVGSAAGVAGFPKAGCVSEGGVSYFLIFSAHPL